MNDDKYCIYPVVGFLPDMTGDVEYTFQVGIMTETYTFIVPEDAPTGKYDLYVCCAKANETFHNVIEIISE
jgi:hypothetical protein